MFVNGVFPARLVSMNVASAKSLLVGEAPRHSKDFEKIHGSTRVVGFLQSTRSASWLYFALLCTRKQLLVWKHPWQKFMTIFRKSSHTSVTHGSMRFHSGKCQDYLRRNRCWRLRVFRNGRYMLGHHSKRMEYVPNERGGFQGTYLLQVCRCCGRLRCSRDVGCQSLPACSRYSTRSFSNNEATLSSLTARLSGTNDLTSEKA